jgi:hypothetical protein
MKLSILLSHCVQMIDEDWASLKGTEKTLAILKYDKDPSAVWLSYDVQITATCHTSDRYLRWINALDRCTAPCWLSLLASSHQAILNSYYFTPF